MEATTTPMREALTERTQINLSASQQLALAQLLSAPAKPTKAMKNLMNLPNLSSANLPASKENADWSAIQETQYLLAIPGMLESIKAGMAEPLAKNAK